MIFLPLNQSDRNILLKNHYSSKICLSWHQSIFETCNLLEGQKDRVMNALNSPPPKEIFLCIHPKTP